MNCCFQCLSTQLCKVVNSVTNYFSKILGISSTSALQSISVDSTANAMESGVTRNDFPDQRERNSHRPNDCGGLVSLIPGALLVSGAFIAYGCYVSFTVAFSPGVPVVQLWPPPAFFVEYTSEKSKNSTYHAQNNVFNFCQIDQFFVCLFTNFLLLVF